MKQNCNKREIGSLGQQALHQHRGVRPMRVVGILLILSQRLSGDSVQNSYFMLMDPALVYCPRRPLPSHTSTSRVILTIEI